MGPMDVMLETAKRAASLQKRDKEGVYKEDPPKEAIKMKVFDPNTEEWIPSFAKNCCYFLMHKQAFDEVWEEKNASVDHDVLGNEEEGEEGADVNDNSNVSD